MKRKDKEKLAKSILAEHADQDRVYVSEDGQAFFAEGDAKNHARIRKHTEDPEVFFRDGIVSDDSANNDPTIAAENETLKAELEESEAAIDVLEEANSELKAGLQSISERYMKLDADFEAVETLADLSKPFLADNAPIDNPKLIRVFELRRAYDELLASLPVVDANEEKVVKAKAEK